MLLVVVFPDVEAELITAEAANPTTTPTRFLRLQPRIHFITIPDSKGYQLIPNMRLSPPVIGLQLPSAATSPTYILGELNIHIHLSLNPSSVDIVYVLTL